MGEQPDGVQKGYRAAALRVLADIEGTQPDISTETKVEALVYLAEALLDLAETLAETLKEKAEKPHA